MIEFYPHIVHADAIIYHNAILNSNAFAPPGTHICAYKHVDVWKKSFVFFSFYTFLRGADECISHSLGTSITLSVYLSLPLSLHAEMLLRKFGNGKLLLNIK